MAFEISNNEDKRGNLQKKDYGEIFAKWAQTEIKLGNNKLSVAKKEKFFNELHTLLSSGVDIKSTFDMLLEDEKSDKIRSLYSSINDRIIQGKSLSEAITESGKFNSYDFNSIKIGEETGKLNEVLKELSAYYYKVIKQRRLLTSALSYPMIVLFTAVGAVVFMMKFMIPMFKDIFIQSGNELPALTQFIVNVSNSFSKYSITIVFLFIIIGGGACMFRKHEKFRYYSSFIVLRIPYFGNMMRMIYAEKFFHSMSLLVGAKVPVLSAIRLVEDMIGFYPFELALKDMKKGVLNGMALHECMRKFSIFDHRALSLVKVGEEVNQLENMFDKLSNQYSNEVEHKINMLGNILEPILIIFVGSLVGFILIAMYLPMFKMSTTIF